MADVSTSDRKIKISKSGKVLKRRPRNPEEWHKQKQKRLRIAGQEYINANGKVVPPKEPGPDCKCRRRCFAKVPEEVRLKTFQGFYSMKTHDEQNAYLFGLMRQIDIKRKRKKASSRRTCTFEYFVRVRGRETQVCQTAFKNIHAITERKVRVLCKKMDDGVMFPSDNRGKNSHRRSGEVRLPPGVGDQIKHHIYSIVHTHRLKDFIRLDKVAGLEINISKMWKDYIKTYDPDNVIATMPKSKRIAESASGEPESIQLPPPTQLQPIQLPPPAQPQQLQPVQQQETFATINYQPGGGHIVNIGDNYFTQSQYQTATLTTGTAGGYYQQSGPILLQPGRSAQPTAAYIVLQPKQEPQMHSYPIVTQVGQLVKLKKEEKRRGPLVKQWRYSNIFHEEINGAALAAIKTRLGMYYAESDAARKKTKHRPPDTPQAQPVPQQQPMPQTHTVTIYT